MTRFIGSRSEDIYQNQYGETITLKLKNIVDVAPLLDQSIENGAELYARHFRNYQAYCDLSQSWVVNRFNDLKKTS